MEAVTGSFEDNRASTRVHPIEAMALQGNYRMNSIMCFDVVFWSLQHLDQHAPKDG